MAYERERKEAIRGSAESAGLAPKMPPTQERRQPTYTPMIIPVHSSDFDKWVSQKSDK